MTLLRLPALVGLVLVFTSACGGAGMTPRPNGAGALDLQGVRHSTGLGPVLSSKLGGTIGGWDMNQSANDGFLTEFVTTRQGTTYGVETFDEPSATITKLVNKTSNPGGNDEPYAQAIMGNDIGFIDIERLEPGFHRNDGFKLMNPVSGQKINGGSKPPQIYGVVPSYVTNNQSSSTQAMMVFRFARNSKGSANLYVYDDAKNAWLAPITFGPREIFVDVNPLYAAVDGRSNKVYVPYLAGQGSFDYLPPRFDVYDGTTGQQLRGFKGLGHGPVNGMAIDSTTGVMCTTTFGDMDVEFYNDTNGKGFAVTIPGGGGPLTQGAFVAVDQVHHLFLIAQLNSTVGPGSAVLVYDEKGNLVESISGFSFLNQFSAIPVRIAVNGGARIGYAPGPNVNNLQSFTY